MKTIEGLLKSGLSKIGYTYKYNKIIKKFEPTEKENYLGKKILSYEEANDLIKKRVQSNNPFFLGRLGAVELSALYNSYLYGHQKVRWDKSIIKELHLNAGFFPIEERFLDKFVEIYIESVKALDILGVWFNEGEEQICKAFCTKTDFIKLEAIEPYYHSSPWSSALEGKNVLVIHPFAKSIQSQFENNKEKLFKNKKILPDFNLITIQAVQTIAGNKTKFNDWFEALDSMYAQINEKNYDIAIIGAGAYGLPLGAFVKKQGKQSIHMGGATQILFGIKGKRWENMPFFCSLFNDSWIRPEISDMPKQYNLVENGCYW